MDKKDPKEKAKEIVQSPGNSMLAKGDVSLVKAQDNQQVVQCVASFNDWMPIRMKTLRTLNMEKFSLDIEENEINKKTYLLDN